MIALSIRGDRGTHADTNIYLYEDEDLALQHAVDFFHENTLYPMKEGQVESFETVEELFAWMNDGLTPLGVSIHMEKRDMPFDS